jgi:serine/threonine-protein kinase
MSDTKFVGSPTVNAPLEDLATTAPPPVASPDALVGKVIDGRYQIESVLGQGGMGLVYKGRHKLIDKRVAIKVLRGEMQNDQEVAQRFLQEARAASAIGNQHIIDISDFGVLPDGATYFVMEFLDGSSLSSVMERDRPLPVSRILKVAKQIAQGLGAAHTAGIIHRDLKPDNVMLIARGQEKDFVKILDFGIAKVGSGESAKLTRAGSVFGTPHYMSPEQAAGATVTQSTDIYSLGVMLYEMAAGKVPFDAENFMGILTMHMYKAPVPMRALVPAPQEIPPGLDAIVLKCLSKKAEARYPTMEALIKDLETLEAGGMPEAVNEMMARSGGFNVPADYFNSGAKMPPPVPATPAPGQRSRLPLVAGIAGVLTAVGIVVAILAKSSLTSAQPDVPPTTTVSQAATVTAPPTSTTTTSTAANAANATKIPVAIAIEPGDAKVTRDGVELPNPVVLQLADGETVDLVVAKPGYVQRTITASTKEPSMRVKLEPVPSKPVLGAGTAKPTPSTKTSAASTGYHGGVGLPDDPFKTGH